MPTLIRDTYPLTALETGAAAIFSEIEGTKSPIYLTVEEAPQAVLLDAREYDRLRNLADLASEEEGIRQGEEDFEMGRSYPIEEVFEEIRRKFGLSR